MSLSDTNTQLLRPDEVSEETTRSLDPARRALVEALLRQNPRPARKGRHRAVEDAPDWSVGEDTAVICPARRDAVLGMPLPQRPLGGQALAAETATRRLPSVWRRLGEALHALKRGVL